MSRTEFVVPQGRDIVLPCSFDGKPEPHITWMKNGVAISKADYHYRMLRSGRLAIPYTRLVIEILRVEGGEGRGWMKDVVVHI